MVIIINMMIFGVRLMKYACFDPSRHRGHDLCCIITYSLVVNTKLPSSSVFCAFCCKIQVGFVNIGTAKNLTGQPVCFCSFYQWKVVEDALYDSFLRPGYQGPVFFA